MGLELADLNTRDLLLLSQLIERHGLDIGVLYETFVEHPAFVLSHNELNGQKLDFSQEEFQQVVNQLLEQHRDLNSIQLCELFYARRVEELTQEIDETHRRFHSVKGSL